MVQSVNTIMENLFVFMEAKGVLRCCITNEHGKFLKKIMLNEITKEGDKLSSGTKKSYIVG